MNIILFRKTVIIFNLVNELKGKRNWVFASAGVGVFGTTVIYSAVLLVLKRRQSGKKRQLSRR